MRSHDLETVLGTLQRGNVLFVLVGEPEDDDPLRLVVSQHPTNLDVLGSALDRLGSQVRASPSEAPGVRRVGDPLGTVRVSTACGDVDLLFGGPRRSLYAETVEGAEERDFGGVRVQWAPAPATVERPTRATGRSRSRRLMSLAEDIAHLIEREHGGEAHDEDGDAGPG